MEKISGLLNINMLLIQEAFADATGVAASEGSLSFIDLLLKGGFWLVPLVILWVMAIYIYFERLRNLNRASKTPFKLWTRSKI